MLNRDQHSQPSPPRETVVIAVGITPNSAGKFDLALVFDPRGVVRTFYRDCTDPRFGASLYFDWIEEYIAASVLGGQCFSAQLPMGVIMLMSAVSQGFKFGPPEEFTQPTLQLTELLCLPQS